MVDQYLKPYRKSDKDTDGFILERSLIADLSQI